MEILTNRGKVKLPDPARISPSAKRWAEVLHDVVRIEEVYAVIQVMLDEAYNAGIREAAQGFFRKWVEQLAPEVIDVEWKEVKEHSQGDSEAGVEGSAGPQHQQPAAVSQADGSAEHSVADGSLPGGAAEGA